MVTNFEGGIPAWQAGEYLDLAFPAPVAEGHAIKSRAAEHIFRFAFVVPEWQDGAPIGWERSASEEDFADLLAAYRDRGKLIAELQAAVKAAKKQEPPQE